MYWFYCCTLHNNTECYTVKIQYLLFDIVQSQRHSLWLICTSVFNVYWHIKTVSVRKINCKTVLSNLSKYMGHKIMKAVNFYSEGIK